MTQGRFDTTHNCRPRGWDSRRHWTNWHHDAPCSEDHKERESCPFHDVRAGGQFQYEYCGSGVGGQLVEPGRLTKRSDARHMIHGFGRSAGATSGGAIPTNTEAGAAQESLKREVDGRPWSHVPRLRNGLFSSPPYVPQGPASKKMKAIQSVRPFTSGSKAVPFMCRPISHSSNPYDDSIDRGRIYHMKGDHCPRTFEPHTKHIPCPEPNVASRPHEGPFYAGKAPGLTFGGPLTVEPEPYGYMGLKNGKRPFMTWHTHTKFSMPVDAPWSTGKTTAEPIKGSGVDCTLSSVPAVVNQNRPTTIGKENALQAIPPRPPAVEFRPQNTDSNLNSRHASQDQRPADEKYSMKPTPFQGTSKFSQQIRKEIDSQAQLTLEEKRLTAQLRSHEITVNRK
jgi:hypothetical protein